MVYSWTFVLFKWGRLPCQKKAVPTGMMVSADGTAA